MTCRLQAQANPPSSQSDAGERSEAPSASAFGSPPQCDHWHHPPAFKPHWDAPRSACGGSHDYKGAQAARRHAGPARSNSRMRNALPGPPPPSKSPPPCPSGPGAHGIPLASCPAQRAQRAHTNPSHWPKRRCHPGQRQKLHGLRGCIIRKQPHPIYGFGFFARLSLLTRAKPVICDSRLSWPT